MDRRSFFGWLAASAVGVLAGRVVAPEKTFTYADGSAYNLDELMAARAPAMRLVRRLTDVYNVDGRLILAYSDGSLVDHGQMLRDGLARRIERATQAAEQRMQLLIG